MSPEREPKNNTIQEAARLLSELEPGYIPEPLFSEMSRLVVRPAIELVPFKKGEDGSIKVLMIKRPPEDPFWPNELHVPGTVLLPSDTIEEAFGRLSKKEVKSPLENPKFVDFVLHQTRRGKELALVHWVEIDEEPQEGRFYDVSNLPEETIEHHRTVIETALKDYLQQ